MKVDPRIEAVRAAYVAASFDERTPDEAGFGARFASEFKPMLLERIGFNLKVADARRFRRRVAIATAMLFLIGFFPATMVFNLSQTGPGLIFFLILCFTAIGAVWRYVMSPRPDEKDPNHATVIAAVVESFGCRLVSGHAPHHPLSEAAPMLPDHSRGMDVDPEYVVGDFDGRMRFAAARVITREKYGKHTTETFRGWYLRVDLPFRFSGTTVIRDGSALTYMEMTPELPGFRNVDLEDPAFRNRLSAMSTDQVEARVILTPDVIRHIADVEWNLTASGFALAFAGSYAHVWLPSQATALSDWRPLQPPELIEDIHEAFAELAAIRAILRDIDVIAESEGFRAQAARNASSGAS